MPRTDQEDLLEHMASCTHYYPAHWKGKASTIKVKDEVSELFPYKAQIFLIEVLSVVLTPAVLFFSLPRSAPGAIDCIEPDSNPNHNHNKTKTKTQVFSTSFEIIVSMSMVLVLYAIIVYLILTAMGMKTSVQINKASYMLVTSQLMENWRKVL